MSRFTSFAALLLCTLPLSAFAGTLTTQVAAQEGRQCTAYLRIPDGSTQLPLIVELAGTGLYSKADDRAVAPQVGYFLGDKKAAVLSIDKPGIGFAKGEVTVNEAVYNQHVQQDLVLCLNRALEWATAQKKARFNGRILLTGHSEGAITIVRLLRKTQQEQSPLLPKIKLAVLSGLPMEPFEKIITSQLSGEQKATFETAFQKKDDAALRALFPVAYPYLQESFKSDSITKTLKELAAASLKTNIQVFQGLTDHNVSPDAVREFERWNNEQHEAGKPALRFSARYYEAGHGLNLAAANDIVMLLEAYLAP